MKRLKDNYNLVRKVRLRKIFFKIYLNARKFIFVGEVIAAIMIFFTNGASSQVFFTLVLASITMDGLNKIYGSKGLSTFKEIVEEVEKITDKDFGEVDMKDLEIVPKNIKVGENLDAANIIPIFKEGYYIVIGRVLEGAVLRQLEEDDKMHLDLLDEDERIDFLIEKSTDVEWQKKVKELTKKLEGNNHK